MQAHFINCRTMEVFRQIPSGFVEGNSLAEDVRQASPPLDHWRKFVYCQSMTGRVFGDVDHFQVTEVSSYHDSYMIHISCHPGPAYVLQNRYDPAV